jgi:hypothetical protein
MESLLRGVREGRKQLRRSPGRKKKIRRDNLFLGRKSLISTERGIMSKDVKDDVFGCEIVVNGSTYYLSPMDKTMSSSPGDFVRGYRLEKQDKKKPGVYDVIQTSHGFECDCRDFTIRHAGEVSLGCKHLRALFFFGFLERAAHKPAPVMTPGSGQHAHTSVKNIFPL